MHTTILPAGVPPDYCLPDFLSGDEITLSLGTLQNNDIFCLLGSSSSFDDLEEAALTNQKVLATKPLIQPISPADQYWLTSTYGYRKDPFTRLRRAHHGIDLAGQIGLKIYATGDGVVKLAEMRRA